MRRRIQRWYLCIASVVILSLFLNWSLLSSKKPDKIASCNSSSHPQSFLSQGNISNYETKGNVSEGNVSIPSNSRRSVFIVDTPGCKIADMDPYDISIRKFIWREDPIQCRGKPPITYVDDVWIRINRTVVRVYYYNDLEYCVYQPIVRPPNGSDDIIEYTNDRNYFQHDTVVNHEFVRVHCFNKYSHIIYINFHAFVMPQLHVDKKYLDNFKLLKKRIHTQENLNVLMVGIDSVSRLNMIRQMPKTRDFLLHDLGAVELLGYNKVADNTFPNIVAMTTGMFVEELPWDDTMVNETFDKYNFVWKNFSAYGYRTMMAEDAPQMGGFNSQKAGFRNPPVDHYFRPLSLAMEAYTSLWSVERNCFSNELEANIVLDYVYRFIKSTKGTPFFAFTFLTRLTHDFVNRAGTVDIPQYQFLKRLQMEGHLNNTILIYFSDHGIRYGDFRNTFMGKMEERLPLMFVRLPQWFRQKYPKLFAQMSTNSLRLTTPFDIHKTLFDILYFNNSVGQSNKPVLDRGISLFDKLSPERTCEDAGILPHWCTCVSQQKMSTSDPIVLNATRFILSAINSQTTHLRHLCSELKLGNVHDAWRMIPNEKVLRHKTRHNQILSKPMFLKNPIQAIVDYQIKLSTTPGNGLFEVTVLHYEEDNVFAVMGEISRINMYGNQSDCTDHGHAKKFCYCLSHLLL